MPPKRLTARLPAPRRRLPTYLRECKRVDCGTSILYAIAAPLYRYQRMPFSMEPARSALCGLRTRSAIEERVRTMANKTELNLLLRSQAGLPEGLRLVKKELCEGWCSVQTRNAKWLEREICAKGWSFDRMMEGLRGSGVGETSQKAIAAALRLALRQMSEQFSAVEVERIQLTQYPWFFLARASVSPIRIQQRAVPSVSDEIAPPSTPVAVQAPQYL
jgi:hypothetical protein